MSDIDRDLIFSTPADRLWEAAIRDSAPIPQR
jgi:hypothetical protein